MTQQKNGPILAVGSKTIVMLIRAHLHLQLLPDVSRNFALITWRLNPEQDLLQLWKQFVSTTGQLVHRTCRTGAALRRKSGLVTIIIFTSAYKSWRPFSLCFLLLHI